MANSLQKPRRHLYKTPGSFLEVQKRLTFNIRRGDSVTMIICFNLTSNQELFLSRLIRCRPASHTAVNYAQIYIQIHTPSSCHATQATISHPNVSAEAFRRVCREMLVEKRVKFAFSLLSRFFWVTAFFQGLLTVHLSLQRCMFRTLAHQHEYLLCTVPSRPVHYINQITHLQCPTCCLFMVWDRAPAWGNNYFVFEKICVGFSFPESDSLFEFSLWSQFSHDWPENKPTLQTKQQARIFLLHANGTFVFWLGWICFAWKTTSLQLFLAAAFS